MLHVACCKTISDKVIAQEPPVSKKRDASSPLQESTEIRKESKSHIQGSADNYLGDIDESCSNTDSSYSEVDSVGDSIIKL